MNITQSDKDFFKKYGYLKYNQVLTEDELTKAQKRSEDIAITLKREKPKDTNIELYEFNTNMINTSTYK